MSSFPFLHAVFQECVVRHGWVRVVLRLVAGVLSSGQIDVVIFAGFF